MSDGSIEADRKQWETVIQMMESHEMPPTKRPRPETAELDAALKSIHGAHPRAYFLPLTVTSAGPPRSTARSLTYEEAHELFAPRRLADSRKSSASPIVREG